MQQKGRSTKNLLQTHGIIDSMTMVLRKRSLNIMERGWAAMNRSVTLGL